MLNRLSFVLASVIAMPAARAAIIEVPGHQPNIQAGINGQIVNPAASELLQHSAEIRGIINTLIDNA